MLNNMRLRTKLLITALAMMILYAYTLISMPFNNKDNYLLETFKGDIDFFVLFDNNQGIMKFFWAVEDSDNNSGKPVFKINIAEYVSGDIEKEDYKLLKKLKYEDLDTDGQTYEYKMEKYLAPAQYSLYISAYYPDGSYKESNPVPILVEDSSNDSPHEYIEFSTMPDEQLVYIGEEFTYAAHAYYSEDKTKELTYEIIDGPEKISVAPTTGLISWIPETQGFEEIIVRASLEDNPELYKDQYFSLYVKQCHDDGRLTVQVRDADGEPVSQGYVMLFPVEEHTGSDEGSIEFDNDSYHNVIPDNELDSVCLEQGAYSYDLDGGSYYVVYYDLYGREIWYGDVSSREESSPVEIECAEDKTVTLTVSSDYAEYTVGGRVTDINGTPVENIAVIFESYYTDSDGSYISLLTATDSEGYYSLKVADFTTYLAYCLLTDESEMIEYMPLYFNQVYNPEEAEELTISADRNDIDFTIEYNIDFNVYTVSGKVAYEDETPISGASVIFEGFGAEDAGYYYETSREAVTDSEGAYSIELPDAFKYTAMAMINAENSDEKVMFYVQTYNQDEAEILTLDSDRDNINFIFENRDEPKYGSGISGTIKDEDGNIIKDVVIEAYKNISYNSSSDTYCFYGRMILNNQDGSFEFDDFEPGTYILFAFTLEDTYIPGFYKKGKTAVQNWEDASRIVLDEHETKTGLKFVLPVMEKKYGYSQISGRIKSKSTDGEDITGAAIYLKNPDNNKINKFELSNMDGSFRLRSLAAGSYTIIIDKPGYEIYSDALNLESKQKVDVGDIVLQPETVGVENNFTNSGDVKIYPNPAGDKFNVSFYSDYGSIKISLMDLKGNEIYSEEIIANKGSNIYKHNVMNYTNGLYFVVIDNGDSTNMIPIPINH